MYLGEARESKAMKYLRRILRRLVRTERGFGMLEVMLGVALMGTFGIIFLTSVTLGLAGTQMIEEQNLARIVAQAQMEDVKAADFIQAPATYPATITPPEGYSVSVAAVPLPDADAIIQKVIVTVSHEGRTVVSLEDYKVDR